MFNNFQPYSIICHQLSLLSVFDSSIGHREFWQFQRCLFLRVISSDQLCVVVWRIFWAAIGVRVLRCWHCWQLRENSFECTLHTSIYIYSCIYSIYMKTKLTKYKKSLSHSRWWPFCVRCEKKMAAVGLCSNGQRPNKIMFPYTLMFSLMLDPFLSNFVIKIISGQNRMQHDRVYFLLDPIL